MLTAFTIGAKVMLLRNFVVELNLMNGAIGEVVDIVYKEEDGPRGNNIPAYVVVDFPKCSILEGSKWREQEKRTNIPIPSVTERCEKKCCSITTVPLRVCKAITVHKGQGITVGPGETWEKVVIYFIEGKKRSSCGIELVGLSRTADKKDLYIGNNTTSLTKNKLKKIGQGEGYNKRHLFEKHLQILSFKTQLQFINAIKELDESSLKTFEGGCKFLCKWYRSIQAIPEKNSSQFKFKDVVIPENMFKQSIGNYTRSTSWFCQAIKEKICNVNMVGFAFSWEGLRV